MTRAKYIDMGRLFSDHGIDFHVASNGWLQLACPYCYRGDGKFGLGWSGTAFNCFRCGSLDRLDVMCSLLNTQPHQTLQVMSQYRTGVKGGGAGFDAVGTSPARANAVKLPYGTAGLSDRHKQYLIGRNFDPDKLVAEWNVQGTGPVGPFAYRIIIPIYINNVLACYQGRDITGLAKERYKSCSDGEAVISVKDCLYGIDKVENDSVIITEGPTKVWRLGAGYAIGTLGATVTKNQIKLLTRFRRLFIIFDEDDAGRENADKMARTLAVLGKNPNIISIGVSDVGNIKQSEADALVRDLLS